MLCRQRIDNDCDETPVWREKSDTLVGIDVDVREENPESGVSMDPSDDAESWGVRTLWTGDSQVRMICRDMPGHPLAIEFAVSGVRSVCLGKSPPSLRCSRPRRRGRLEPLLSPTCPWGCECLGLLDDALRTIARWMTGASFLALALSSFASILAMRSPMSSVRWLVIEVGRESLRSPSCH